MSSPFYFWCFALFCFFLTFHPLVKGRGSELEDRKEERARRSQCSPPLVLSFPPPGVFLFSQEMIRAKRLHFSRLPEMDLITFQGTSSGRRGKIQVFASAPLLCFPGMPPELHDSLSSRKKPTFPWVGDHCCRLSTYQPTQVT